MHRHRNRGLGTSVVFLLFLVFFIGTLRRAEAADAWVLTNSMTTGRSGHTATLLADGRVLVNGGDSSPTASAEIYDPTPGTWSLTGPPSTARYDHTATRLPDGRVLVAGGYDESGAALGSSEVYDPAAGTWSLTGPLITARTSHTATRLSDGRVLITGGAVGDWSNETTGETDLLVIIATAELYDPASGTWSPTDTMGTARRYHTATRLSDGRVLVAGGISESSDGSTAGGYGGPMGAAEIYDPAVGTWSWTGSMSIAHAVHTATLLADGRVLVAGGGSNSMTIAEIYNPAAGTWSLTGSMSTGRYAHTASRLSDGRVLVTGDPFALARTEIYDPALGTWSPAARLSTVRYSHTATLLSDNRVLVTGGFTEGGGGLATAERYSAHATPPDISCGAADGTWHNSDVSFACTASDPESGLANAADASFTLTTNVSIGDETADARTNSRHVCNTVGDCTVAGPIVGNKVDRRPPSTGVATPGANVTYEAGATAPVIYDCSDLGSGVASCQGSVSYGNLLDTSSPGAKTFSLTSTDNVGHSTTRLVNYSVGGAPADVGILLSAPKQTRSGGTLTYSIEVRNASASTATGVVVSNATPAGTVFASASSSQGTVTAPAVGNGTVTVNLGNLPASARATISVAVTVVAKPGTVLTDTATVTTTTQDLNGSNNSATQKTTVSGK
jgi:uncharacterized repeat protein (TIGR01451 family)